MHEKPAARAAEGTIPVTEERLEVGRRTVETGGAVRVRKRVQEVPAVVHEPLVYEDVETVRVPIGRVLDAPATVRQEGDVTIVPVVEERLVVRKELVLVEEIHLVRRRDVRETREQVLLRRESVVVERFDPATQQWLSEPES